MSIIYGTIPAGGRLVPKYLEDSREVKVVCKCAKGSHCQDSLVHILATAAAMSGAVMFGIGMSPMKSN
jgi:hypothetical protein